MRQKDEIWGLFWCNLLHPIIFEHLEQKEVNRFLKDLCKREILFPDGKVRKPSISTLRRKLKLYGKAGFKGLARKKRSDLGRPRSVSSLMLEKAVELKKDQALRSHRIINQFLKVQFANIIPKATLYRYLKEAGATKLKLGISKLKTRRRWTKEHTHDLWVGDFQDGVYVLHEGQIVPTSLCAFIDCHSRYIIGGRYYLKETLDILIDCLLRAWTLHGICLALYVDNAKVFHANQLKAACYDLGIELLHRPVRDAAPGGLIERFFETSQGQFEAEVRVGEILTLDSLNQAFAAYLSVTYHHTVNSETGQSPQERYDSGLTVIRHADMDQIINFFMKKETRTVDRIFSDIRLNNRFYQVDPKLRGDKVLVHYDPFSDIQTVFLYSTSDQRIFLGKGVVHQRQQPVPYTPTTSKSFPKNNYIDLLLNEHEKQLTHQSKGIDYRLVIDKHPWPFTAFVQKISRLLGHKGALSAFNTDEYELLKKTYNSISEINQHMLQEAFSQAQYKTLPYILYELKNQRS